MFIVEKLSKKFGEAVLFSALSFELHPGEVAILKGVSGSGKSTLLNCIAGLESYDSGRVMLNGSLMESGVSHPDVNMVFQSYELFPNYDVISNVMLPLVLAKKIGRKEAREAAEKLLKVMGLSEKANERIESLSGGQQQRLAIARACIMEPKLLLLDEPSSALDAENRAILIKILKKLMDGGMILLIATHDSDFIEKLHNSVAALGEQKLKNIDLFSGRVVIPVLK